MYRRLLLPNHSFRLILYLEWILLSITLLGVIRPTRHAIHPTVLIFSIIALISFGLMGLKLPTEKTRNKLLYTAGEFGLLFLTFLIGQRTVFFPLLGLIMVIRGCLMFQQLGRQIVAGLVFGASLVMLFKQTPPPHPRRPPLPPVPESFANTILTLKLNTAVTFGLTVLFTLLLVNALLAERQSREKLLLANEQLRQYALRIEDQAMLQERNRIAREIHDALGHTLTAQSIQLENALLFLSQDVEKTEAFLREAKELGTRSLQEVRRSLSTLRSDPLQGQTLEGAIAKLVSDYRSTTGIVPHCTLQVSTAIPAEITTALYRIIQESFTNIYKHSGATQVTIFLQESPDSLYLQIADNGQGFDPERNTTGFGLQGMRERTTALNGQFFLTSQPGKGCRIQISIPLPKRVL